MIAMNRTKPRMKSAAHPIFVISTSLLVLLLVAAVLVRDGLAAERLPTSSAYPPQRCERLGLNATHLDRIEPLILKAQKEGEFAGCVVAIGRRREVALVRAYGYRQIEPTQQPMQTDTVFDLASLTKPIATGTAIMILLERGELRLRDPVHQLIPGFVGAGVESEKANEADAIKRQITVEHLLTHTAGYIPDNSLNDYQDGPEQARQNLIELPPEDPPGNRFRYSDVSFQLLGIIVEEVSGKRLDQFLQAEAWQPLAMADTGYNPAEGLRDRAAATEQRDGEWLIGQVHDPRAAKTEGVAGHAGLFSTASDLSRYARMLLNRGTLDGKRLLSAAAVREMTRPRTLPGNELRAAGWDVLSGYSRNRGELFSPAAFGHGGFTGTAIWIDPRLDLFVVFLSNRLHPDGKGSVNDLAGKIGTIAAASIKSTPSRRSYNPERSRPQADKSRLSK